jgi:hypothetical protein
MNSDLVDRLARAFAISTFIGGSLLRYVGIPKLSDQPVPPTGPPRLERALGLRRPQLQIMRDALGVALSSADAAREPEVESGQ